MRTIPQSFFLRRLQHLMPAILFVVCVGLNRPSPVRAEDRRTPSPTSVESTRKPKTEAESVDAKLDQILMNQEDIFKRLDKIMEELKIVKIRATIK